MNATLDIEYLNGPGWDLTYTGTSVANDLSIGYTGVYGFKDNGETIDLLPGALSRGWHYASATDHNFVEGPSGSIDVVYLDVKAGNDTVRICSTNVPITLSDSVSGDNQVFVGGNGARGAQDVTADVDFQHSQSFTGTMSLTVDNSGDTTARNMTVGLASGDGSVGQITGLAQATIFYGQNNIAAVNILSGSGTDSLAVQASPSNLTYDPGAGNDNVTIAAGAKLDLPNGSGVNVGSLSGSGDLVLGGKDLALGNDSAADTFNGSISGAGSLTKVGSNTLALVGACTYSGPTTINGGTLALGANNVLPDDTAVTVSSGAALDLGGVHDAIGSLAGDGNVNLGIFGGALTAGGNGASTNFSGAINGFGVVFTKTGAGTMTVTGTISVDFININGGTLTLGANDRLSDVASVTVASGATFDVNGFHDTIGSLAGNGNLSLDFFGALTAGGNGNSTNFGGAVSGILAAFTKTGSGTMTVSGAMNINFININGGTLRLAANDQLSDVAAVTVASGATFDVNGFHDTIGSLAGNGNLSLDFFGALTAGGNGNSTNFGGAVSGIVAAFTKTGSGTMTVSGPMNINFININGGTLRLAANDQLSDVAAVTVAGGASFDVNGAHDIIGSLGGDGNVGLGILGALTAGGNGNSTNFGGAVGGSFAAFTKTGSGTMTVSGPMNINFININGGALKLGANDRLSDVAAVTVASGGLFDLNNFSDTIGSLAGDGNVVLGSVGGNTLTIGSNNSSTTFNGQISGAGNVTKTGTGTLTYHGLSNSYTGTTTVLQGILAVDTTDLSNDTGIVGPIVIGDASGPADSAVLRLDRNHRIGENVSITVNASGKLDQNGHDEYIGTLAVIGGHVNIPAGQFGASGLATMSGGLVSSGANGGFLPLGGVQTNGDITATISANLIIFSGTWTLNVADGASADDLVISGVISSGKLVKAGAGTLTLSAANTYTGTTTINVGTLKLGSGGSLSAGTAVTVATGATFDLRNQSTSIGSLAGAGNVALGSAGGNTLTIGSDNSSTSFDGQISGAGNVAKAGIGTLTYHGPSNSYTGTTTVLLGTLAVNTTGNFNEGIAGDIVIGDSSGAANSAVLRLDGDSRIDDGSDVTVNASGLFNQNGHSEGIRGLTVNRGHVSIPASYLDSFGGVSMAGGVIESGANGTLSLIGGIQTNGDATATISANVSLSNDTRVTMNVADGASVDDLVINGVINSGSLVKTGPGTLMLSNANTYTGPTIVKGGVVRINGSQVGSPVAINTGGTLGGGGTIGTVTSTGGILSPGVLASGNVTLDAASTFKAEIGGIGAGQFDQLKVTGTVDLGSSQLQVSFLNGFVPPIGAKFTLIDNDGTDPVVGHFKNLLEGGTLKSTDGSLFHITYTGGDGNDVVLQRFTPFLVFGPDAGFAPRVRVFNAANHTSRFDFNAYPASFRGGVRVATADVNGDGYPDIITAPGVGTPAIVKVFSGNATAGQIPTLLYQFKPYGNFKGGVNLAAGGDVNGDHIPDIITAPGAGMAPTVKIYSGANGALLGAFNAYAASFKRGVSVAAGDVNGDGVTDIVTGMGAGTGSQPRVRAFNAATHAPLAGAIGSFFALAKSYTGGINVAVGDVNGDGLADIIVGPSAGVAPNVKVYDQNHVTAPRFIAAYAVAQKKGVRVTAADLNGDGKYEILTALGPGGNSEVRIFNDVSPAAIDRFFAQAGAFTKGMFLAGSR